MLRALSKILLFFALTYCLYPMIGSAQGIAKIDSIDQDQSKLTREKLYLHIPSVPYASGDTLWFAGYLIDASNQLPAESSHFIHVDLIQSDRQIIKSLTVQLHSGYASGYVDLPDTLGAGWYQLRAYTHWMRNFDPGFFFNKSIYINPKGSFGKVSSVVPFYPDTVGSTRSLQVFPESGQLIQGLKSKVILKTAHVKGFVLRGQILDQSGRLISEFNTDQNGMAAIYLIPEYDKIYRAKYLLANGSTRETYFPQIKKSGYLMRAESRHTDSLYVEMRASQDLVGKHTLTLVARSKGKPVFYMLTNFPDQLIYLSIPKVNIPSGLLQFVLLDSTNKQIAERFVFNETPALNLQLDGLKSHYLPQEEAKVVLNTLNPNGQNSLGSFSVEVVKVQDNLTDQGTETDLYQDILLHSNFKRLRFFRSPRSEVDLLNKEELDNFLITKNDHDTDWSKQFTAETRPVIFPAEIKFNLNGHIVGRNKIKEIPVNLLAGPIENGWLLDTLTDENGSFHFNLSDSMFQLPLRLQAKPKGNESYKLFLDPYQPAPVDYFIQGDSVLVSTGQKFDRKDQDKKQSENPLSPKDKFSFSFNEANQLKDIEIRNYDLKPKLKDSHSANLNGAGKADVLILPETLEKMPNLLSIDVLLPGVRKNPTDLNLRLNSSAGLANIPNVLILVDGMEDPAGLAVSPRDLESVEFLKTIGYTAIYGLRGSGGVLLLTTKRGHFADSKLIGSPNSLIFEPPVQIEKTMYFNRSANKPSSLLYWNSSLITDQQAHAVFSFRSGTEKGKYCITIEGLDVRGNLAHQKFFYTVN